VTGERWSDGKLVMREEEVRFAVLGAMRAWRGEVELDLGQPKQQAVLAALLLRAGESVALEDLIDDVWGDRSPVTSARAIQRYVYLLRRVLGRSGGARIRTVGSGYVLDVESRLCDMRRFTRLLCAARRARADADAVTAVARFDEGLALWAGTALAGVPGPYAAVQRARLSELRLSALLERLACMVDLGRHTAAAVELRALAAEHPLREELRELQMLALYGAGRQAEALEAFRETRLLLREEFGVEPGPGLRAVRQRIVTMDPTLPGPAPASHQLATLSPPAPAQLPAEAGRLLGRADQLAALTTLAGKPGSPAAVLAISGAAGIGKTALALHWAHQVVASFPDGQLYVDLRGFDPTATPVLPEAALRGFLDALGVAPARIPGGLDARASLYRGLLAGKRMLIVLDNARDPDQVRPLLPGSADCRALITSRDRLAALVARDGAHSLTLDHPFTPRQVRDLLSRRPGAERAAVEPADVEELIALCARLPLPLEELAERERTVRARAECLRAEIEQLADRVGKLETELSELAATREFLLGREIDGSGGEGLTRAPGNRV